jgi:hypothetical protein
LLKRVFDIGRHGSLSLMPPSRQAPPLVREFDNLKLMPTNVEVAMSKTPSASIQATSCSSLIRRDVGPTTSSPGGHLRPSVIFRKLTNGLMGPGGERPTGLGSIAAHTD